MAAGGRGCGVELEVQLSGAQELRLDGLEVV
jgi:hypothetical protein